eukprot:TRINITY_DN1388_c0_g2_i10.p1 TRINITY_DN1388_c0_g2~~TRINITY_DN1388_c0_g2_i10.p1  ORF type:complete len:780 (-),score=158.21 TRINITY_DN1388_c0_g2_i10:1771-4110(-)
MKRTAPVPVRAANPKTPPLRSPRGGAQAAVAAATPTYHGAGAGGVAQNTNTPRGAGGGAAGSIARAAAAAPVQTYYRAGGGGAGAAVPTTYVDYGAGAGPRTTPRGAAVARPSSAALTHQSSTAVARPSSAAVARPSTPSSTSPAATPTRARPNLLPASAQKPQQHQQPHHDQQHRQYLAHYHRNCASDCPPCAAAKNRASSPATEAAVQEPATLARSASMPGSISGAAARDRDPLNTREHEANLRKLLSAAKAKVSLRDEPFACAKVASPATPASAVTPRRHTSPGCGPLHVEWPNSLQRRSTSVAATPTQPEEGEDAAPMADAWADMYPPESEEEPQADVPAENPFLCGVCSRTLSSPVTLPCGHTFCKGCLDSMVDEARGEVSCVYGCRCSLRSNLADTSTPTTPSQLQVNQPLAAVIVAWQASQVDQRQRQQPQQPQFCAIPDCPSPCATIACLVCGAALCSQHNEIIHSLPLLSAHARVLLADAPSHLQSRVCEAHRQELLLWCVQCRTPACALCAIAADGAHARHRCVTFVQAIVEEEEQAAVAAVVGGAAGARAGGGRGEALAKTVTEGSPVAAATGGRESLAARGAALAAMEGRMLQRQEQLQHELGEAITMSQDQSASLRSQVAQLRAALDTAETRLCAELRRAQQSRVRTLESELRVSARSAAVAAQARGALARALLLRDRDPFECILALGLLHDALDCLRAQPSVAPSQQDEQQLHVGVEGVAAVQAALSGLRVAVTLPKPDRPPAVAPPSGTSVPETVQLKQHENDV